MTPRLCLVTVLATCCLGLPLAFCENAPVEPTDQQIVAAFQAKDYPTAEALCRRQFTLHPDHAAAAYNLACALAREGHPDQALDALAQSEKAGFSDGDHTAVDDDLASLHDKPRFAEIVKAIRAHPASPVNESSAAYEKGVEIANIKTVEGQPAGGLRWRLRMGIDATAAAPQRLIIWLHPSGASGDQFVEPLETSLAAHGFALAVFSQKQYNGWTSEEINDIAPSINDLAKQPGIDAKHPILMGFSAGGQAALLLWKAIPKAWAGLLLDAAYPVDMATRTVTPLTAEEIAAKTPVMAIIGAKDGGIQVWQQALPDWVKAGIPVILRSVPDHGHQFMFYGAEWEACLAWLDLLGKPAPPANPGANPAFKEGALVR